MAQQRIGSVGGRIRVATTMTVAALVVGLAAAACGSGDNQANAKPAGSARGLTSTPAATAAPSPTRSAPHQTTARTSAPPKSGPTKTQRARSESPKTESPKTEPPKTEPSKAKTAPASPTATTQAPRDTLRIGMSGADVAAIQRKLDDLGYWNGTPDGSYGDLTSQAVMAYQKAAGLTPDGIAGPQTQQALTRQIRPNARSTSGNVIEVDLEKQLVLVVLDGQLKYIFNTSTGSGQPYTEYGATYIATTPTGRFAIQRTIDAMHKSPLGLMWRPRYFYAGYALHGDSYVPGYPASHGCVRLANGVIDFVWSADLAPIGREVWVY